MKKFLLAILLFLSLAGSAQVTTTDTLIGGWKAIITRPDDYFSAPGRYYNMIVFFAGLGEAGGSYAQLRMMGPHAYVEGGWDGTTVVSGVTIKNIIVSLSQVPSFDNGSAARAKVNILLSILRVQKYSLTGLSAGGHCAMIMATEDPYDNTAPYGPFPYCDGISAVFSAQGVQPDDNVDYLNQVKNFVRNNVHGRYLGIWGTGDAARQMPAMQTAMNSVVANSAVVLSQPDNHDSIAFRKYYGSKAVAPSTYTIDGIVQTTYQWLDRQMDTSAYVPGNLSPTANAGIDQTVTLPTSTTTLTGSGSDLDGTIASYLWAKQSGPTGGTITSSTSASTGITALQAGTYVFRLTVTDNLGATGFDDISVNVVSGSTLVISAGTDQTISRFAGMATLYGVKNQPTATTTWKLLTPVRSLSGIGKIHSATKDTTAVTILPYTHQGNPSTTYFDYQMKVKLGSDSAYDTVRINITYGTFPPQVASGSPIRMVTGGDITMLAGLGFTATTGDAIITGANDKLSGSSSYHNIYFQSPAGIDVGPGHKIWVNASSGKYADLQFNFDSTTLQVHGTESNPVIMTPYGGGLNCLSMSVTNVSWLTITGKYVAGQYGSAAFPGHDNGYAFSQGKYGITIDGGWQSLEKSCLILGGKTIKGVTLENIEITGGNFAGLYIKTCSATAADYDSITIRGVYVHGTHGEGIYLGCTGNGLNEQFNYLRIYNSRFLFNGNENMQMGRLNKNNYIEYNVSLASGMNWQSAFETNFQGKNIQLGLQNGNNRFRNNIVRGTGGDESVSVFSISAEARDVSNNDTNHITNNLIDYTGGFIGNYLGATAPVANAPFEWKSNIMGRNFFKGDLTFSPGTYGTNTNQVLRTQVGGTVTVIIKSNIQDYSKVAYAIQGSNIVDSSGGVTRQDSIKQPLFVNSGWPDDFNWTKISMWGDTLMRTWGNEYGSTSGTLYPAMATYDTTMYVMHLGKYYKSKVQANTGHMPTGVTDTYWQKLTWSDGVTTYDYPPDDYRLKQGDYYNLRGIGLLDNINTITPVQRQYFKTMRKFK